MEIWKEIKGYNGFYEISNLGNCKTHYAKGNGKYIKVGRVIKPVKCTNGYLEYQLSYNGIRKCHLIHRLVAEAFIENPKNKPEVNHKDEDIMNNNVDNLEWVTSKENANYGTRNIRVAEKLGIAVAKLDEKYNLLHIYDSLAMAANEHNVDSSAIIRVCKGKQKTSIGYKWMYYNDYLDMITRREVAV